MLGICAFIIRRKKMKEAALLADTAETESFGLAMDESNRTHLSFHAGGITLDKSVEFSYEELANATDNFSISNQIGQGGFGAVYYAQLRGEKAAIKKMSMRAWKEFTAELTVLTNVHHLNLVRLIGYCTEGSLFVVYEYVENGNLSQHLRRSAKEAAVKDPSSIAESRGLVWMFEVVHNHPNPNEICKLIDPRMEDNYPLDAVLKMAQVAKACTNEDPHRRPTMRSVAVALMTLSSQPFL